MHFIGSPTEQSHAKGTAVGWHEIGYMYPFGGVVVHLRKLQTKSLKPHNNNNNNNYS